MIGTNTIGEVPIGALDFEPVRGTVALSVITDASARAVILGAAFQNLLSAPLAHREYLVVLNPLQTA